MNCGEFERAWQERLDQPGGEVAEALTRHAAECPGCARRHDGYLALNAALAGRATSAGTVAPPGFADRILAAPAIGPRRVLVPLAMAAGVVLAIGLAWNGSRRPDPGPEPTPVVQTDGPRPLAEAVAEFTTASLAFARETSAPAARLGLEALSGPEPDGPAEGEDSLQALGTRLSEEIAPLRGSTRRAFSFLLGPEPARIDAG